MQRRTKGFSMLEVLIAGVLALIAIFAIGKVFVSASRQVTSTQKKHTMRSGLTMLSGNLQKFMATGDVRFLAFSPYAEKPLVRFILPLPGRCGDLGNTCADDVSVLFAHYDKSTHPSVVTICAISSDTWLIDLNNTAYGNGRFDVDGFMVDGTGGYASGKIPIMAGKPLALFNAPFATIWIAADTPRALVNPSYDSATQTLSEAGNPLPADCGRYGTNLSVAANLTRLYAVRVTPYVINQFTVSGNPTNPMSMVGTFPLRMFPTQFRTVGRRAGGVNNNYDNLVLTGCTWGGGSIDCNTGNRILSTPEVTRMRLETYFSVRPSTNVAIGYELLGPGMSITSSCEAGSSSIPSCLGMATNIPLLAMTSTSETFENLNGNTFSLLKQEALSKLRLKLTFTDKEEKVDVIFNN